MIKWGTTLSVFALWVFPCDGLIDEKKSQLNIALHSQSRYSAHGWVAGSEITTAGMLVALRRHPGVARADVFAPFAYDGLNSVEWDVLLIEGWTGPINRVIHTLRSNRFQSPDKPPLLVLLWCLDTYPDLDTLTSLDVDGFLTNSRTLVPHLGDIAPTLYLPLAADPEVMASVPKTEKYAHPVVYLGQASLTKHRLLDVLHELLPLGLVIYGLGWDRFSGDDRFAPLLGSWAGVLPKNDIASLYSSASVVVGTTELEQRSLGMVNNRVFEALSVGGACFLSDSFPALDELALPLYPHRAPGDAFAQVSALLRLNASARADVAHAGRVAVLEGHTYDHRVAMFLPWLHRTFGLFETQHANGIRESLAPHLGPSRRRPNFPKVLLLYGAGSGASSEDGDDESDPLFHLGLLQGVTLALGPCCDLVLQRIENQDYVRTGDSMMSAPLLEIVDHALSSYRLVLVRAQWGSPLQTAFSRAVARIPAVTFEHGGGDPSSPSSRGTRWASRALVGLLLRSNSPIQSHSALEAGAAARVPSSQALLAFDVVVHDDSALFCHQQLPEIEANPAGSRSSSSSEVCFLEPCAHPNAVSGLSLDVGALREGSHGWHDPPDLDARGERTFGWDYVVLAASPGVFGLNSSDGIVDRLCSMASQRVAVLLAAPTRPKVSHRFPTPAESSLELLRGCGVTVVGNLLNRPERISSVLRSAKHVEVLSSKSPLQRPRAWDATGAATSSPRDANSLQDLTGSDAVLLLAALAVGAHVSVESDQSLSALLQQEVEKVAVLGRPPLADFDVSSALSPRHPGDSYAEAALSASAQKALVSSTPARLLAAAMDSAFLGPRASARIAILQPPHNGVIPLHVCREALSLKQDMHVHVEVKLDDFRVPDDGTWCLQVDEREVACFGDARFAVEAPLPSWGLSGDGSSWCVDGGSVRLQAVLRGGSLEVPSVVRMSPVVYLRVAS